MSEAEFIFRSMNTHQILVIVVDTRILCCVANSLQECRFASIGPSDYKYTKVSVFRSEIIGIAVAHHVVVCYHWVRVKRAVWGLWEQYHGRSCWLWLFTWPNKWYASSAHASSCIKESNGKETWWMCFEARGCATDKLIDKHEQETKKKQSMSFRGRAT